MTGRILVLGGTGFLGRAVVRRLLGRGWRVRCAARNVAQAARRAGAVPQLEFRRADIRDVRAVKEALRDVDGVVNAVSLYVERPGGDSFEAIHVDAAQRVAALARLAGLGSLVHISGIGVDEASPSSYVRARARGERRVREAFPDAVVLRPSVLFGPGDAFLRSLELITRYGPVVPLFGNGSSRLQPVYVEDVAEAVVRALELPGAGGRVFELGGPGVHTYREVIAMVLVHLRRRRLLVTVPYPLWRLLAAALSVLPEPPLTRDQVHLMAADNVVGEGMATFTDLGLAPRAMEPLLAECLGDRA
jgi:uncharacterized protein YbjT (DUF2867 family)